MPDFPLQRIEIEDFRRLNGHHAYDLDAPIVLIHGPNGSGKTSILSALELGLTGQITGLDETDDDQFKYLPYTDASGSTVRVDVAQRLTHRMDRERVTVSRTRGFSGPAALAPREARFYRERCYLDQASLGRLLEIYQDTDKAKESVLARFVNELLGLEQLDALRDGLYDATNVTRLRKRAIELGNADQKKKDAALRRMERTRTLNEAQAALDRARGTVLAALNALGHHISVDVAASTLLDVARTYDLDDAPKADKEAASAAYRQLLDMGGQLNAIQRTATGQNLDLLREAATNAEADLASWRATYQANIDEWDRAATLLDAPVRTAGREEGIQGALEAAQRTLRSQVALRAQIADAETSRDQAKVDLEARQTAYDEAKEHASTLVEGLVAVRPLITGTNCPVCDRDYTEVGEDLGRHVDTKIQQLTEHSRRLMALRTDRDTAAVALQRYESALTKLGTTLLAPERFEVAAKRVTELQDLADSLRNLQPVIQVGAQLAAAADSARSAQTDLEAASSTTANVARLTRAIAASIGATTEADETLPDRVQRLTHLAVARIEEVDRAIDARRQLASAATNLAEAMKREVDASRLVSEANLDEGYWDERVTDGASRHKIAKELHDLADKARSHIIQQVFTTELNGLWSDLFTRLAPNETYVPAFGTVTNNKSVEPKLMTRHRNGDASGTPRLMLSAGNLNTAALSLFLALHLTVKNDVPCLVFDDPVQAMDEVHIAQFAALVRTLSKNLGRQVVIAVHERELFDYLAIELSPAFEGDELITIRLGDNGGWSRETYRPDTTIAG